MNENPDDSSLSTADKKKLSTLKSIQSILFDQSLVARTFFILVVIYTLYFARELLLPIFLAFLLYFLFFPVVEFLKNKLYIPKFVGSALLLIALLILLGYAFYFLSYQSKDWLSNGSYLINLINKKLATITSILKKPVEFLIKISQSIESSMNLQGINLETSWYSIIFSNTWELFIEFWMTLIFLYFLLASNNPFLSKIVKMVLRLKSQKEADPIVQQIEEQVWKYLFTRSIVNIGVAIIVSVMLWAFQLPNPILWGIMAGILEFIPFIGAFVSLIVISIVSLISFDNVWHIILPPLTFLVFISLEGNLFVPYVLGRSMIMNKIAVVFFIFLFGWIWGAMGSFLAIPIVMTVKIILDNINKHNIINELLEE